MKEPALFELLPAREQLSTLSRLYPAADPIWVCDMLPRDERSIAQGGDVVLPKVTCFGILQILIADEVWENTEPNLYTNIGGLNPRKLADFEWARFKLSVETIAAFDRLSTKQARVDPKGFDQNRLRVFQVRFTTEESPSLGAGEFFLDLASHMFLLAVHHSHRQKGDILFRCRGELRDGQELLVGYQQGTRVVKTQHALPRWPQNVITAIGYAP